MTKHDKHLPRSKDNKGVAHDTGTDSKTLERLARDQGTRTKEDAKAARQRNK